MDVSVPFTSGSSLQLLIRTGAVRNFEFQFPLHRDPRCNLYFPVPVLKRCRRFSSLYIGILAATVLKPGGHALVFAFQFPLHRDPRCNLEPHWIGTIGNSFSSLYIGILAATASSTSFANSGSGFSSLYIGILAATDEDIDDEEDEDGFSSLYIGILAAT